MAQLTSAKEHIEPVLFKRARHVISESDRVLVTLKALKNNDIATISMAMKESHISLRDDFEVTTKEIDGLVHIIDDVLGIDGGVRMTGGGFGGCVVALVPLVMVEQVENAVNSKYEKKFGLKPSIYNLSLIHI